MKQKNIMPLTLSIFNIRNIVIITFPIKNQVLNHTSKMKICIIKYSMLTNLYLTFKFN